MSRTPPYEDFTTKQHQHLATMVGDGDYQTCMTCGRLFVPHQRPAKYCLVPCRQRAHDQRRRKR